MTRSDTLRLLAAIAACVLVIGLFVGGALLPALNVAPVPWDKLAHGTTYFVLTVLVYVTSRSLRWAAPLAITSAVLDEFHRAFMVGDKSGIENWLADAVGIVLACMVIARTRMPMQRIDQRL